MATYVIFNGELVDRRVVDMLEAEERDKRRANFPCPKISRMEPYESPITGKEVTSWGERDRELKANDAYDPRDVSTPYRRGREAQAREAAEASDDSGFEWR